MIGSDYDDYIKGYDGNDKLWGGAGDDWLRGSAGKDTLIGGSGKDVFYFFKGELTEAEPNTIIDFKIGQDRINVLGLEITSIEGLDITQDPNDNSVFIVKDRKSDFYLRVKGTNGETLTPNDFIFYDPNAIPIPA